VTPGPTSHLFVDISATVAAFCRTFRRRQERLLKRPQL